MDVAIEIWIELFGDVCVYWEMNGDIKKFVLSCFWEFRLSYWEFRWSYQEMGGRDCTVQELNGAPLNAE